MANEKITHGAYLVIEVTPLVRKPIPAGLSLKAIRSTVSAETPGFTKSNSLT